MANTICTHWEFAIGLHVNWKDANPKIFRMCLVFSSVSYDTWLVSTAACNRVIPCPWLYRHGRPALWPWINFQSPLFIQIQWQKEQARRFSSDHVHKHSFAVMHGWRSLLPANRFSAATSPIPPWNGHGATGGTQRAGPVPAGWPRSASQWANYGSVGQGFGYSCTAT